MIPKPLTHRRLAKMSRRRQKVAVRRHINARLMTLVGKPLDRAEVVAVVEAALRELAPPTVQVEVQP